MKAARFLRFVLPAAAVGLPVTVGLAASPPPAVTPPPAPAATTAAAAPAAASAHADPPAKNLQVLPRDWTRRQVVDEVMRKWTADLGVRCGYCHGDESKPMKEWDFASDAKPTKLQARRMYQMLEEINRRLGAMPNLHDPSGAPLRATCYTCHHGAPRPRHIEELFEETRSTRGIDAAIAEYKDMRAHDSLGGSYDFSARPLLREAHARLAAKDEAGAQKLVDLALELGLDSVSTRSAAADVALARGDRKAALEHLQKALAMAQDPDEKEYVEDQIAKAKGAAAEPTPH